MMDRKQAPKEENTAKRDVIMMLTFMAVIWLLYGITQYPEAVRIPIFIALLILFAAYRIVCYVRARKYAKKGQTLQEVLNDLRRKHKKLKEEQSGNQVFIVSAILVLVLLLWDGIKSEDNVSLIIAAVDVAMILFVLLPEFQKCRKRLKEVSVSINMLEQASDTTVEMESRFRDAEAKLEALQMERDAKEEDIDAARAELKGIQELLQAREVDEQLLVERIEIMNEENKTLLDRIASLMQKKGGREKYKKPFDETFINVSEDAKNKILDFLNKVQEEDKYMSDRYARRLIKYYIALRTKLYYTNASITVYSEYFFPNSGKSNESSYRKTFTNNYNEISLSSPEVSAAVEKIEKLIK